MVNTGYIYLIKSTSGHYKIGISKNPKSRLKQLASTTGPYELELVKEVMVTNPQKQEAELHAMFDTCNVLGEWFDFSVDGSLECVCGEFDSLERVGMQL